MQTRKVLLAVGLAAGGVLAPLSPVKAQARTLVAIVNRNRPEVSLSSTELVQIFRGEIRYWPANRDLIQLAMPSIQQTRNDFIRKVLRMTPTEWDREWKGKRYRGEAATIPHDLTRTEVMQAVQSQPRFLAVVELDWLRSIDARLRQDLKILRIDGKNPDEADYPLRLGLLWLRGDLLVALGQ